MTHHPELVADSLREKMGNKYFHEGLDCFKKYTGWRETIGVGCENNTPVSGEQLLFTLALYPDLIVQRALMADSEERLCVIVDMMATSKILDHMKILDVGCGTIPCYARCARALGADVYTVDYKSADDFEFDSAKFSPKQRAEERKKHVQVDLNNPNAIDKIGWMTKGSFDFITSAYLGGPHMVSDNKVMDFTTSSDAVSADNTTYIYAPKHLHKKLIPLLKRKGTYQELTGPDDFFPKMFMRGSRQ